MKTNLVLRVLLTKVAVASTLLGLAGTVHATASIPPTEPVKASAPVVMSMETFNQRKAVLPELSALKKGDTVVLWDDGRVTDAVWRGNFTYYPAGSVVPRTAMYARWKDGVVTLTPTPDPKAGQPPLSTLDASFVQLGTYPTRDWQTIKTLIKDGNDPSILRIPGNAWLFREDASGQLTALVDVFVYESGSKPIPHMNWKTGGTLPSTLPKETGQLPLPIAAQPGIH